MKILRKLFVSNGPSLFIKIGFVHRNFIGFLLGILYWNYGCSWEWKFRLGVEDGGFDSLGDF